MTDQTQEPRKPGEHKVVLLASHFVEAWRETLYIRELDLPFVPAVGMQILRSGVHGIWTTDKGELAPLIESVIYDLDEERFICTFTIDTALNSSFWETDNSPSTSVYRDYLPTV